MKKFSTAVLLTVLLTGFLPLHAAWSAGVCEWAANAPDKHQVRSGDTLWDIASLFLNNPWCWPEVWKPNQSLINNPHWIYPGQIIVLNRLSGSLGLEVDTSAPLHQLGPAIRSTPIVRAPLPLLSEKSGVIPGGQQDILYYISNIKYFKVIKIILVFLNLQLPFYLD